MPAGGQAGSPAVGPAGAAVHAAAGCPGAGVPDHCPANGPPDGWPGTGGPTGGSPGPAGGVKRPGAGHATGGTGPGGVAAGAPGTGPWPAGAPRANVPRSRLSSSAPPTRMAAPSSTARNASVTMYPKLTATRMLSTITVSGDMLDRPRPSMDSTGEAVSPSPGMISQAVTYTRMPMPPKKPSTANSTRHSTGSVLVARPIATQTPAR